MLALSSQWQIRHLDAHKLVKNSRFLQLLRIRSWKNWTNKAKGLDSISARLLKEAAVVIAPILTRVFQSLSKLFDLSLYLET